MAKKDPVGREQSLHTSLRPMLGAGLLALLPGCASMGINDDSDYDKYADKFGAHALIGRDTFEPISLVSLLSDNDPPRCTSKTDLSQSQKNQTKTKPENGADQPQPSEPQCPAPTGDEIDRAITDFGNRYANKPFDGMRRRNEIQERILAASDQRCGDFKNLIQRKSARMNFWLGTATTAASLAATIVDGVEASKILAGVAGLASGVRAEYNQEFFANVTAAVIVTGIESRRQTAYEQILLARRQSLTDYPVAAAIKDGIRYHSNCSLVAGMQEAGDAVRYFQEPGLSAATRTVARAKMLADLQETAPKDALEKITKWQDAIPADRYLAGTPVITGPGSSHTAAVMVLENYFARVNELSAAAKATAGYLAIAQPADKDKPLAAEKELVRALTEAKCREAATEASNAITLQEALIATALTNEDRNKANAEQQRNIQIASLIRSNVDNAVQQLLVRFDAVNATQRLADKEARQTALATPLLQLKSSDIAIPAGCK